MCSVKMKMRGQLVSKIEISAFVLAARSCFSQYLGECHRTAVPRSVKMMIRTRFANVKGWLDGLLAGVFGWHWGKNEPVALVLDEL